MADKMIPARPKTGWLGRECQLAGVHWPLGRIAQATGLAGGLAGGAPSAWSAAPGGEPAGSGGGL